MISVSTIRSKILPNIITLPSSPFEQCGFWYENRLIGVRNHARSSTSFQISARSLHHYLDGCDLIWHTHLIPNSNYLSYADIQLSRTYNKPILSYHVETQAVDYYDPNDPHPFPLIGQHVFEGLPYKWNRCDCHHLVRAWYEVELGIKLPPISFTEAEEYELGQPHYTKAIEQVKRLGFVQVDESEVKVGALVIMNLAGTNPHHCGVITHEGEGGWMMLHHKTDEVSEITRLRKYRSFVHSYWNLQSKYQGVKKPFLTGGQYTVSLK